MVKLEVLHSSKIFLWLNLGFLETLLCVCEKERLNWTCQTGDNSLKWKKECDIGHMHTHT